MDGSIAIAPPSLPLGPGREFGVGARRSQGTERLYAEHRCTSAQGGVPSRKRELKRSIIRKVRTTQAYGYELHKMLASEGERVQLSYLYKTLKEMCDEGLLVSKVEGGAGGPRRRTYRLSVKGQRELGQIFDEATELIHSVYEEYVAGLPSESFAERFDRLLRVVCDRRPDAAIVVSHGLTPLHRKILDGTRKREGSVRTFLVKPPGVRVYADFPNLNVVDGTFEDIPLKDRSLDAMVVVDIQAAEDLQRAVREFRRVLRAGGVVFACAPFMGLGGRSDPLDVGEFMKKMTSIWSGTPYLDKEMIEFAFAEVFDYVDVGRLAFLTGFISGLKPIKITEDQYAFQAERMRAEDIAFERRTAPPTPPKRPRRIER